VIEDEVTVTVMAGKLPVTLVPFSKMPMPKVTTMVPPDEGVTAELVASVMTTCTGPVKAPAGTEAVIVALPTVPVAVPPLGWMVVLVTTVPASPVAVPPVVGLAAGV
jgi:CBS-domain-containing membrane protein